jgi:glycosyltransferase involved in cell wall biosynthesis
MTNGYSASKALIYPSINETIGLPLIESNFFNLSVISADMPYAFEFLKPNYTFNPNDPASIAKAISRSLSSNSKKKYLNKINLDINNFNDLKKIFL